MNKPNNIVPESVIAQHSQPSVQMLQRMHGVPSMSGSTLMASYPGMIPMSGHPMGFPHFIPPPRQFIQPQPPSRPTMAPFVPFISRKPVLRPATIKSDSDPAKSNPVSTVYVGRIPPKCEDNFLKNLLCQCGIVSKWTRISDPESGQLKSFGFCEFATPQAALRALRILKDVEIDNKKFLLNVDGKTKKALDEYEEKN